MLIIEIYGYKQVYNVFILLLLSTYIYIFISIHVYMPIDVYLGIYIIIFLLLSLFYVSVLYGLQRVNAYRLLG